MNIVVKHNQTLLDVALILYGSIDNGVALARANGLAVHATILAGTELIAPDVTTLTDAQKKYIDKAGISPATYYEAPAPAPDPVYVIFGFPTDYDDNMTVTAAAEQAADFVTEALSNVAAVAYEVNAVAATLPFTVAAGDTVKVTITRTDAGADASVKIANI